MHVRLNIAVVFNVMPDFLRGRTTLSFQVILLLVRTHVLHRCDSAWTLPHSPDYPELSRHASARHLHAMQHLRCQDVSAGMKGATSECKQCFQAAGSWEPVCSITLPRGSELPSCCGVEAHGRLSVVPASLSWLLVMDALTNRAENFC